MKLSEMLEAAHHDDSMCLHIVSNDGSLDDTAAVWIVLQPEGSESALVVQCSLTPDEREASVMVTAFRDGESVPAFPMVLGDGTFTVLHL